MLEPLNETDDSIIIEFKVYDPDDEKTLEDTAEAALHQIEEKHYGAALETKNPGVSGNMWSPFTARNVLLDK